MSGQDPGDLGEGEEISRPASTSHMRNYFDRLTDQADRCYEIAREVRRKGMDPTTEVEMPMTDDLASRVEKLVGPPGIARTIRRMAKDMDREQLALEVALAVVGKEDFGNPEEAMYQAIRTGLAVLTEGVLVAPLEGVIKVVIQNNDDGTSYPSVFFAGPIRSAGGTGQALSVLLADMVRRKLNLGKYRPTAQEIERYKEEMPIYRHCQHLQYTPSSAEVEAIVANCPVCIDGEGTDDEVSGHRNLPRVFTNRTRGGACLVIAEGMVQKASKILKHVDKLKIDGWDFLRELTKGDDIREREEDEGTGETRGESSPEDPSSGKIDGMNGEGNIPRSPRSHVSDGTDPGTTGTSGTSSGTGDEEGPSGDPVEFDEDIDPGTDDRTGNRFDRDKYDYVVDTCAPPTPIKKYMQDIIAGRPVFAHPSTPGGFRLRYGRARTTGLAATTIHPASMVLLDGFLAIGTQMKMERPGKAGAITPCDSIEGPIVLLQSGDLIQINDVDWAEKLKGEVKQIIDVGEILTSYGEFLENNMNLVPGAFSPEWWRLLADQAFEGGANINPADVPTPEEAFRMSEEHGLPLHPEYNLFWHDLTPHEIHRLALYIRDEARYEDGTLIVPSDEGIKDLFIRLGALHIEIENNLIFDQYALALVRCTGMDEDLEPRMGEIPPPSSSEVHSMRYVTLLAGVTIMPRAPTRVGGRMGRPEKAKERKMKPPPHVLFPISQAGGPQRILQSAVQKGMVEVKVGQRICLRCRERSILPFCECGGHTVQVDEPAKMRVNLAKCFERAKARLGETNVRKVKAVQGMISRNKTPEPIEKGILRSKHGLWVFKDGTIRFDMTDLPLTHFRPSEVDLSLEKARELGYTRDIDGNPLESEDQMVELKVQDLIVSNRCGRYLLEVTQFVDELLTKFYGVEPFYRATVHQDLIGHLLVGLAPHTSAGVLGRLIGFTTHKAGYAHPYFHAAKRRNCDGDEDSIMLLMDCLLNFSKSFLPEKRGGQMDAPLVLSTRLDPNEIDKEAQNIDLLPVYPLEFYEATLEGRSPKELEDVMDVVSTRIGKPEQYEGFLFTHNTSNINMGPVQSAYTTLTKMQDKMEAQFELARKIRAVDAADVAAKVIESHFLPDLVGNLRKFSKQSFRCTKCNRKYRRLPLKENCLKCGGNLTLTVYEKSVKKYLEPTKRIADKYNVPNYTKQRVLLVDKAIDSLFENDKIKKSRLEDFGLDGYF